MSAPRSAPLFQPAGAWLGPERVALTVALHAVRRLFKRLLRQQEEMETAMGQLREGVQTASARIELSRVRRVLEESDTQRSLVTAFVNGI